MYTQHNGSHATSHVGFFVNIKYPCDDMRKIREKHIQLREYLKLHFIKVIYRKAVHYR